MHDVFTLPPDMISHLVMTFFAKMGSAFVQLFPILSHFSARDFASLQLVSPPMTVGAINVSQSQKTFVFEALCHHDTRREMHKNKMSMTSTWKFVHYRNF